MVHECKCGFRGKDAELEDGKCPRCGTSLVRQSRRSVTENTEGTEGIAQE